MEEQNDILYTKNDIQRIFKCSENTAYKLINTKGFPTLKIGKKYLIPKNQLMIWINENVGTEIII